MSSPTMGANGKVVLPPEAESEAWTQAEINLFRSSNGFVRPKRGEEVKKPANALAAAAMIGGASTRVVRLRGPAAKVAEVSKLLEQMVGLIDGVEIEFVAQ